MILLSQASVSPPKSLTKFMIFDNPVEAAVFLLITQFIDLNQKQLIFDIIKDDVKETSSKCDYIIVYLLVTSYVALRTS